MNLLRIKDNSKYPKESFHSIPKLKNAIADKTINQLSEEGVFIYPGIKESEDLTKEQMILQSVNYSCRTGNIMGFIGYSDGDNDEKLIIQSRFSNEDNEDYFFRYMLSKISSTNVFDLQTDTDFEGQLFNYLYFLFPMYLQTAMRKGLFKEYIRKQYNDVSIKGTIEIARHIKLNTPFLGDVAYCQREFSYDNDVMELIRHTIEFIKTKEFGKTLLSKVSDEIKAVIEATSNYKLANRQKVISANIKKPIIHAFYYEYRALQNLCLWILQHRKHQIGFGTSKIYGILFDGSWLWEEYINTLIGAHFYHPMNKGNSGAQWLFFDNENHFNGLIYPDFISRDKENRIITDAKYKPIKNIGRDDYLQLVAYLYRFDSRRGYYVYPESGDNDDDSLFLLKGSSYDNTDKDSYKRFPSDIIISKLGLRIPQYAVSFNHFCSQMIVSENNFKKEIRFIDL